jgi:hypothetical protein
LVIERRQDPIWSGAARSRRRWRNTARKLGSNKDNINTLSRINGSIRAVRSAEEASTVRHTLAACPWSLRLEALAAQLDPLTARDISRALQTLGRAGTLVDLLEALEAWSADQIQHAT